MEIEISERDVELHRLEREKVRCTSHHRAMEERLGRNYMVPIVKKYESNGNIVLYSDEEIRALEGVWERYMAAWKACTEYEYQFLLPLRTRLSYAKDMLTDARGRAGIYFDDWGSSSEDEPGDFWKGCDD